MTAPDKLEQGMAEGRGGFELSDLANSLTWRFSQKYPLLNVNTVMFRIVGTE